MSAALNLILHCKMALRPAATDVPVPSSPAGGTPGKRQRTEESPSKKEYAKHREWHLFYLQDAQGNNICSIKTTTVSDAWTLFFRIRDRPRRPRWSGRKQYDVQDTPAQFDGLEIDRPFKIDGVPSTPTKAPSSPPLEIRYGGFAATVSSSAASQALYPDEPAESTDGFVLEGNVTYYAEHMHTDARIAENLNTYKNSPEEKQDTGNNSKSIIQDLHSRCSCRSLA